MRPVIAAVLLLPFWPIAAALADAPGDALDGERFMQAFLDDVTTISGRFEQQLVDADRVVIEKSSGTLDVVRPGKFRWTYVEPYEQILVADGRNVWTYDVDLEQVTVKPQSDVLGSTPAALLGGSRNVLDEFEIVSAEIEDDAVWIALRPKNPESGINRVELGFIDESLAMMMFTDNLDQQTLIALADTSFNQPLDESLFEFVPPDGVDVVGSPISDSASEK